MKSSPAFARYAAECVLRAHSEPTPEDKNIMLNLALAWLRLAHLSRMAFASGHARIAPET